MFLKGKSNTKIGNKLVLAFLALLIVARPALASRSITLPTELGRISEQHEGTNGKIIILIQEAHVQYEAQKSIAEILKHFIEKKVFRLILVEGGWGNVGLSYLRDRASSDGRLQVAERYLKEGKISGEEYLDLTSDLDMLLWGIEDPKLYAENMNVFLKFHPEQDKVLAELTKLETFLNILEEKLFSSQLKEFNHIRLAFQQGKASLPEYLYFLTHQTNTKILDSFPRSKKLLAVAGSTNEFDADKVGLEERELIQTLSKVITKLELEQISILKDRKNPEEELEFLNLLLDFYETRRSKLPSLKVDNLRQYQQALKGLIAGDLREIFKELEMLEKMVSDTMALQPDERKLFDTVHSVELLKKLFQLQLGPEEFAQLEKNTSTFAPTAWQNFLEQKALELSIDNPHINFSWLGKEIPEAKSFYRSATEREHALIEHTLHKIEETGDSTVALLVGGFHSEHLVDAFRKLGFSLILISPRFTPVDPEENNRKYFKMLEYKWGSGNTVTSNLKIS